ncbi:MAG: hypothetical protein JO313_17190 [Verrucomicrobia bacterium]|nr:hypothetical protein [Verrucomicrobiota bacterium]
MATKEIQKLDYVREGVRYTIHVEEVEGSAMWGTWNCRDCGVGGSSGRKSATIDEAVDSAKKDLESHHTANHKV